MARWIWTVTGGLSLGDARQLDLLCHGVDLDGRPVLRALLIDLGDLVRQGKEHGHRERLGYVSKCHLCTEVRRLLVQCGDFVELGPAAFYAHLEDRAGGQT